MYSVEKVRNFVLAASSFVVLRLRWRKGAPTSLRMTEFLSIEGGWL
jgi:hypothetical protein